MDSVDAIAQAWQRERPGTPVAGIGIVSRVWHAAKLLGDDRRRTLAAAGADAATLDLLSVLRRNGPPYQLSTRELAERTLVTAGAISQRLTRAEGAGLVVRERRGRGVLVTLTSAGHELVERLVDTVLGREAELVAALTPRQQGELTELLRLFVAGLHDRLGDQRPTQVGS